MSRHPELNGADSAPVDDSGPQDHWCDYCGRTVYSGLIRPVTMSGTTSYLCEACYERQQRRYAESLPKDEVPESATFDGWMKWAGLR